MVVLCFGSIDSLSPESSPRGGFVYVAPLPAGSIPAGDVLLRARGLVILMVIPRRGSIDSVAAASFTLTSMSHGTSFWV
jgi:hypothetical protein